MSSKRALRRKSCEGKVQHETKDAAWAASRKTSGGGVYPYRCSFGPHWHVGHPRHISKIAAQKRREGAL